MAETLRGQSATWVFDDTGIRIQFGSGLLVPPALKALGEVTVPQAAIATVTVAPGWRKKVVLRLVLREGADPLLDVAAGQLKEREDPYRLVLAADRESVAEYYAEELRTRLELAGQTGKPAPRFLLPGPSVPRRFKGFDGEGVFDGETVAFDWGMFAKSRKRRAGQQRFTLSQLEGVEWAKPRDDGRSGYVRLRVHGWPPPGKPEDDLAALAIQSGTLENAHALTFAAAIRARIAPRGAGPEAVAAGPAPELEDRPGGEAATGEDADAIIERIRKLGELHQAGILTDQEFESKKAELLSRL